VLEIQNQVPAMSDRSSITCFSAGLDATRRTPSRLLESFENACTVQVPINPVGAQHHVESMLATLILLPPTRRYTFLTFVWRKVCRLRSG